MFCCRRAEAFFNKGTYYAQIDESKCKKQESGGNGGTSSDGAADSSASLVTWTVKAITETTVGDTEYKVQCWVTHSQISLTDGALACSAALVTTDNVGGVNCRCRVILQRERLAKSMARWWQRASQERQWGRPRYINTLACLSVGSLRVYLDK